MARINWKRCFARFASVAAIASLAVVAAVALHGDGAEACSGGDAMISDMTTFDPGVLGDDSWGGLDYDPFTSGYGGPCGDCELASIRADWHGYLGESVTEDDWDKVLMKASLADIFAIEKRLAGKSTTAPKGYETSSLWTKPEAAAQLYAAVEFVELLKRMEPQVTFEMWEEKKRPADPLAKELAAAQRGLKAAKDPFLKQRYAFAVVRALFYRHEWPAAVTFFDANVATLAAPSNDLKWRARHYIAGALRKAGNPARANLELARIHANWYPLSGAAMLDFHPVEDGDWKEAFKLTKDPKEKAALWRMVGIKHDGMASIPEILKLDPKSPLVNLLVVRELNRLEGEMDANYGSQDPADKATRKKAYTKLESLALKLAATPGWPKPWVMDLVAGHLAAKRGDLATTRVRMQKAVQGAPNDKRVASQAKASLAIALVQDWQMNPQHEEELAGLMRDIDPEFSRMRSLSVDVRGKLAKAYAAAGHIVDAEFLTAGTADPEPEWGKPKPKGKPHWETQAFIKEMIARVDKRTTEFDRFVVKDGMAKEALQLELALRLVYDGDFAGARLVFDTTAAKSSKLETDPFVMHTIDCHDCDHEKFAKTSTWTHKTLIARLVELELKAKSGGEPGAQAALALGNALYNITWYGNARTFFDGTHQTSYDAHAALLWYKRAYDTSGNRELKAKAAWFAAKAELSNNFTASDQERFAQDTGNVDVTPKVWFPIVKKFANTKYYKEILNECGRFRAWVSP